MRRRRNATERSGRDSRAKSVTATRFRESEANRAFRGVEGAAPAAGCARRPNPAPLTAPAGVSAAAEDNESLPAVSATPCFQGQLAAPSMHRGPGTSAVRNSGVNFGGRAEQRAAVMV